MQQIDTVEEIIETLKQCDDEYFNTGVSSLTDREYDTLKRKAFLMEPSNSFFAKVGSDVRGGKTKLPYQMGSLNQIYEGEATTWANQYVGDIIITDKLDGVSCMLIYRDGKFNIAYSRGDGIEGADIFRHVRYTDIPQTVSCNYLAVRAEIIMNESLFVQKYASTFKNPRNMVAGIMNRKESEIDTIKDLNIVAYEIVDSDSSLHKSSKKDMLNVLEQHGFNVVSSMSVSSGLVNDDFLTRTLATRRAISPYELDGLVLTYDAQSEVDASTTASLNPEHSVKYKVLTDDDIVEATVRDVHWKISKNFLIKPRVEIFPVELFGSTVTYATGFNASYIETKGIGKGAVVRITKAGQVIPYLVSVVTPATPIMPPESMGAWEWSENRVDAVIVDKANPYVLFEQVLDFFETYKIDSLKEATLLTMSRLYPFTSYDEAIVELCDLTESEWTDAIGLNGSKIYTSLRNRLYASSYETFLGALPYMGIGFGVRKAKALMVNILDISDVFALTVDDIIKKDGFDIKTATNIVNGLAQAQTLMTKLINNGVLNFVTETKTNELSTVNVVMTGFRDNQLQSDIESKGGKVSSGVSSKTTHLLCNDTSSSSSKMKKAKDIGVIVMTPDEFKMEHGL